MGLGLDSAIGLFYWLRIAGLAGLLALAIVLAWRRWLNGAPGEPTKRVLMTWLAIVLGFAIYGGLLSAFLAPALIFWLAAIVAIWVLIPAVISVMVLDFGAKLLEAERTGFWLAAGIIAYVAVTFIWLGLIGLGLLFMVPGLWLETLAITSIPVTAAVTWWSFLPGGGGGSGVAKTFE
jgi:hypothetical protein